MRERCCRCHTILTSEDKYHYGANCETCNEDYLYAEHFEYYPIHATWRYAKYQMRWLWHTIGFGRSLCVRQLHRFMGRSRSELRHDRRK
jgi:hypothetical protein